MGAQGIVLDAERRVLLIEHGYRPGWHFPGGGVEWGETVEDALRRELQEEAGVSLTGPPRLHGIFTNFDKFPGDHIAVFIVEQWRRPVVPKANLEVKASGFFGRDSLPAGIAAGSQRRLREIFDGVAVSPRW